MENSSITQSDDAYFFRTNCVWPESFPLLMWKGVVYAGAAERAESSATKANPAAVEVSNYFSSFEKAFFEAHPNLGLAELARLSEAKTPLEFDLSVLLSFYNLRLSDNLKSVFKLLNESPKEFCTWVNEKQIGARELYSLKALDTDKSRLNQNRSFRDELLLRVARSNASRSAGVQAMEWAVELYLMDENPNEFFNTPENKALSFDHWHLWLKEKRFSQRTQTREYMERQLKSISWPKGSKVSVFEAGDRLGFEVRIQASDAQDLTKKAHTLTNSAVQLARAPLEELQ